MAWPMPARSISQPMTRPEMKNATTVATAQAASATISTRRNASRCSMIVIRCSSTSIGARRGTRWRTRFRRANGQPSVVGRRSLRFGARSGVDLVVRFRLAGLDSALDLVGQLGRGLSELAHGLAETRTQLGQPAWPEDDQHDNQEHDDVHPVAAAEHIEPIIGHTSRASSQANGSAPNQETVIVTVLMRSPGVIAATWSSRPPVTSPK